MSDKKHLVYICSTYADLKEERRKVLDVLMMADCIPIGIQSFFVTENEQFDVIKKIIDICDYFILIIGNRYGSINKNTGLSYTEMEYHYARKNDIPVLVFCIDDHVLIPENEKESEPQKRRKLSDFKQEVMNNNNTFLWTSSDDLMGKIAIEIMKAKTETVRPGWQYTAPFDEAMLRREIMESQAKIEILEKQLDEANEKLAIYTEPDDIEFDESEYVFKYHYFIQTGVHTERYNGEKKIMLTELFNLIAEELLTVSLSEQAIESFLKKKIIGTGNTYIIEDAYLVKRILNQLQAFNLIRSHLNKESLSEYWGLTPKGRIKIREFI